MEENKLERGRNGADVRGATGGQPKRGKERKSELEVCFDTWVQRSEEADKARELRELAEDDLRRCPEKYKASKESAGEKGETVAGKVRQASQSNHTKSQNLEQDIDSLVSTIKTGGWSKTREDEVRLWAERKHVPGGTRSFWSSDFLALAAWRTGQGHQSFPPVRLVDAQANQAPRSRMKNVVSG